jgi:hypothetical protein
MQPTQTNTLVYYNAEFNMAVKYFIVVAHGDLFLFVEMEVKSFI